LINQLYFHIERKSEALDLMKGLYGFLLIT
ncbi:MAG: hypothetical protein ACJAU1_001875, partial [Psychromonas sp.]